MTDLHDLLDRRASGYGPRPDLFERVLARRRRRERNRRSVSAVVALLVAGVALGTLLRAMSPDTVPADIGQPTTFMQAFLQARIDGEGAQKFVWDSAGGIPLLYATTTGAPYARYEMDAISESEFEVRLFAQGDGIVVDQFLSVEADQDGRLGITYSNTRLDVPGSLPGTTENGRTVPRPYNNDGVTFSAPPPWEEGFAGPWALWLDHDIEQAFLVVGDPVAIGSGCEPRPGPAPADAEALVQAIRSDPDLEATPPVAVTVGGVEALRMDVVAAPSASFCPNWAGPGVVRDPGPYGPEDADSTVVVGAGARMRLYLLDVPGDSPRRVAIAIVAPEARFQHVTRAASAIVDSVEFNKP
jgi:hypothetical protein